jgi:hypothetical protein
LLLSLTATAQAQTLDCQRPASDIDRAICGSADLMTARGAVGVAYEGLLHSLTGAAREHLIADQERWVRANQSLCVETIRRFTGIRVDTQIAACLAERMSARAGRLLAMPAGDDYPFISDHLLLRAGLAARSSYRLFATFPRFDQPGIDNKALNEQIERSARERVDVEILPRANDDFAGPWVQEMRHDLRFPARGVAAVLYAVYSRLDGSRPANVSLGLLVDMKAGRALDIDDVLTEGRQKPVAALCLEELRKDPGDVPREARLVEMLAEPDRWLFGREGVEIVFRGNEEGAGRSGPRLIAIPYTRLKDIIRRDGPLAEKAN